MLNKVFPLYLLWFDAAAFDEQWSRFGSSADGQFVVAISMRNGIYVSLDFGHSWTLRGQIESCMFPCRQGAAAVSRDGRQMLVVSGSPGGFVHRSEDFGATWSVAATNASATLRALAAAEEGRVVYAAGAPGGLWKSSDAAETWISLSDIERQWWGLTVSADGTKVAGITRENYHCICCGCGAIWVSVDAGSTWTQAAADGSFWDITSTGDFTRLWVATRRSLDTASVWISSDSGNHWTERIVSSSKAANELGIAATSDGATVAIVFEELGYYPGWLYLSFDYGFTWQASGFDGANGCNHVAISADGLWLVTGGVFGPPFISTDGGSTWTASGTATSTTTTSSTTGTGTNTSTTTMTMTATNTEEPSSNQTSTTTTTTTTFSFSTFSTSTNTRSTSTTTHSTSATDDSDDSDRIRNESSNTSADNTTEEDDESAARSVFAAVPFSAAIFAAFL